MGAGTYAVLKRNQRDISGRAGRGIEIVMASARNTARARAVVGPEVEVVDDPRRVVDHPGIDIVVEVIGGCTVAKDLVLRAIANGKHVVTANKALLAQHGTEIFAAARARGIELRVHPALVPARCLIANVDGSMNAIMVKSDAAGVTMYYGAGAGSEQTASAVIADLIDITRLASADPAQRVPYLAFQPEALADTPILPMGEVRTSYYLRLNVRDQAGVLADITGAIAAQDISIDALHQQPAAPGADSASLILLTHTCRERDLLHALARIEALPAVVGPVIKLRVENLA